MAKDDTRITRSTEHHAGPHRTKRLKIPIGLEKTLYLAASNDEFRESLLEDREAAVAEAGCALTPVETSLLRSLPESILTSMVAAIDLKAHSRRAFMRNIAACILAGSALIESSGCPATGERPDPPPNHGMGGNPTDESEQLNQDDHPADESEQDDDLIEVEVDEAPVTRGSRPRE